MILYYWKDNMPTVKDIIQKMENTPKGIKYKELELVCNQYFGIVESDLNMGKMNQANFSDKF